MKTDIQIVPEIPTFAQPSLKHFQNINVEVKLGIKRNAVIVILRHEERFLLLKRKYEPNKGKVTPVGGKLKAFENPTQAAIRETYEETGIQLNNLRYVGSLIESAPNKYNWNCVIYISEIEAIEPPFCDEGVLDWYSYEDLTAAALPPTDLPIFTYAIAGKPFFFNADFDAELNVLEMWEEIEGIRII